MTPYNPADDLEFIYPRPEGDIIVFARDAAEALATIRANGFLVTEPEKLRRGTTHLTEQLHKEPIS